MRYIASVLADGLGKTALAIDVQPQMFARPRTQHVEQALAVEQPVVAVHHGNCAIDGQALGAVHVEDEAVGKVLAQGVIGSEGAGSGGIAQGDAAPIDAQHVDRVAVGDAEFAVVGGPDQAVASAHFDFGGAGERHALAVGGEGFGLDPVRPVAAFQFHLARPLIDPAYFVAPTLQASTRLVLEDIYPLAGSVTRKLPHLFVGEIEILEGTQADRLAAERSLLN